MAPIEGISLFPRPVPAPVPSPTPTPLRPLAEPQVGTGFELRPRVLTNAEARAGLTFDEAKLLSSLAYDGQPGQESNGWRILESWQNGFTGFRAILAEPLTAGDPRRVLAFAGTDLTSLPDLFTDALQLVAVPTQYGQAYDLARELHARFGADLRLTGHSLAGGEAALAGMLEGIPAIGINSAPLGLGSAIAAVFGGFEGADSRIVQLNVEGELVHHVPGYQPGIECTISGEPGFLSVVSDHLLGSVDLSRAVVCDDSNSELGEAPSTDLLGSTVPNPGGLPAP